MERLTERIEEHYIARQDRLNGRIIGNQQCLDKLGKLEDAEEQGEYLRLPCKAGDMIYEIKENKIIEYSLDKNWRILRLLEEGFFGTSVFTIKEEAERALAEMKGV